MDFWKNVQKEIKQVLGINFTLDPSLFILGILPDNMTDRDLSSLLRILLLIANKKGKSLLVEAAAPQHNTMERQGKKCFYHVIKSQQDYK